MEDHPDKKAKPEQQPLQEQCTAHVHISTSKRIAPWCNEFSLAFVAPLFVFGLGFLSQSGHLSPPYPHVQVNYYADPMTEEEAEEYWGKQGIQNDFNNRMWKFPNCMIPRWSDFNRSIREVQAEHPDEDLCCYFGYHGDWLQWPPITKAIHTFTITDPLAGRVDPPWGKAHFSDGTEVIMHIAAEGYIDNDDLYCFGLGWLRNQGLNESLITDWDAWSEVTRQECKKLDEKYAFTDSELTMRVHCNGWGRTMWRCGCSGGFRGHNCSRVTKREIALHAYHKCIMGVHAAGGEIAYCIHRGCLLPNNRIGHHADCGPNFPF